MKYTFITLATTRNLNKNDNETLKKYKPKQAQILLIANEGKK